MSEQTTDLKPCPWPGCGGKADVSDGAVFCTRCQATGPWPSATGPISAVDAWNRRPIEDALHSEIAAHQCTEVALREEVARLNVWAGQAGRALQEARRAILRAVCNEDGLDGAVASCTLNLIEAALSISPTHTATPEADHE